MKKQWVLAVLSVLLAFSTQAAPTFNPLKAPPEIRQGSGCPMGECAWFSWQTIAVSSRGDDLIIQATALRGYSEEEERRRGDEKIMWEKTPMVFTVNCSYSNPSVKFNENGKEEFHELPLSEPSTLPAYLESSAKLYFKVCHSVDTKNISATAKKLNYAR